MTTTTGTAAATTTAVTVTTATTTTTTTSTTTTTTSQNLMLIPCYNSVWFLGNWCTKYHARFLPWGWRQCACSKLWYKISNMHLHGVTPHCLVGCDAMSTWSLTTCNAFVGQLVSNVARQKCLRMCSSSACCPCEASVCVVGVTSLGTAWIGLFISIVIASLETL